MTFQAPRGTEWEEHLFSAVSYLSYFLVTQILECSSGEARPSAHNPIAVPSARGNVEYHHFSSVFNSGYKCLI